MGMSKTSLTGKLAYGALFTVALPAGLWLWTAHLECDLPAVRSVWAGWLFLSLGALSMVSAMRQLWSEGGGLPMNAYPPPKVATRGIYALLPHPIYCGFTACCAGAALLTGNPAALWIVTPIVALGCVTLLLGYEIPDLRRRFPNRLPSPWICPPEGEGQLPWSRRVGGMFGALIPWVITYEAVKLLGVPPDAFETRFVWEWSVPILPASMPVYASVYLVVPLTFLLCTEKAELRDFMKASWLAMFLNTLIYVTVPATAEFRTVEPGGWMSQWLLWEQWLARPAAGSFPSFHVTWAVLSAAVLAKGVLKRVPFLPWLWCIALTISCLTTGMHSLADLVAGALVGAICLKAESIWAYLLKVTERLSNNWRAWQFGPLRIMSHSIWSWFAGFTVIFIAGAALNREQLSWLFFVALTALLGAGLWAQWVEGSSALLRPFGYYGSIIGGLLALALVAVLGGPAIELLGALALAAPWTQAVGRFRCIVQGCCHGRPVDWGIRVTNPHSRVVKLAELAGRPIHPTPLYSILANLVIGALLLRMYWAGASLLMIAGLYLVLSGMARFAEEAYRGEPQTQRFAGLPLYQWMAIGSLVLGMVFMTLRGPSGSPLHIQEPWLWCSAVFWGLVCAFAMSMDFPGSTRRFSRLTG